MGRLETHADVVNACGCSALAKELARITASDVSPKRIQGWRIRNSIPGSFFAAVAEATSALGVTGVSSTRLAEMADVRNGDMEEPSEDAA